MDSTKITQNEVWIRKLWTKKKWGCCLVRKFRIGAKFCTGAKIRTGAKFCTDAKFRTGAKICTGSKFRTCADDLVMLVIFTCLVLRYRILYRNITSPSAQ